MSARNTEPQPDRLNRRELLLRAGMGFGGLALAKLLNDAGLLAGESVSSPVGSTLPLAAKSPHFPARARRVIHIFANGGPSQLDTFDPKPGLARYAGKMLPMETLTTERRTGVAFPSPFEFKRYGESGIEVSELFPHVARSIDDICVIRSMHTDVPNHHPSFLMLNCGNTRLSRPSMGSWITYGLGSESSNLPGFIVLCPNGRPTQGAQNWQSAFLPGAYQGTHVDTRHSEVDRLIDNVRHVHGAPEDQRRQLDLLAELNRNHRERHPGHAQLDASIQNFELAYRMQTEASDAFDVTREPESIQKLYGRDTHGRQMLMARRLLERGVRFVQVYHGAGQPWDSHVNNSEEQRKLAGECDRAIGAFLTDLKRRGLLDDTLVVWSGEFGRTPVAELLPEEQRKDPAAVSSAAGRDHNNYGFTSWMAGGGVKGGTVYGATDEFGFKAVENLVHVHDLHATILHLLGFDHERLTYRHAGRDFRLTDVHGRVIREIIA